MLLGTQWYVLFNVIAGAMAMPSDLREAAAVYQRHGLATVAHADSAGDLPVSRYRDDHRDGRSVECEHGVRVRHVQGAQYHDRGTRRADRRRADRGDFPLLLAGTLVMAAIVITGNRLVWRRLYTLAEARYRLE